VRRAVTQTTGGRGREEWSRRDPPATRRDTRRARAVARSLVPELRREGARSVLLAGSWARGDARRASDLDLWSIGPPPPREAPEVRWRAGFYVSVLRTTAVEERRRMRTPPYLGATVPAWRGAVALYDPLGTARRLQREAREFDWSQVAASCDRWVARQMAEWGEEAIKLVRALATGNDATAAVQRNLLAERMGFVLAIHRRWFWDSENVFWERIGRAVGGPWARAQRAALGVTRGSLVSSSRAALSLYALTARAVASTLSPEQRTIVSYACRVAGTSIEGPSPVERRGQRL
jgi:hypothetical protein